MTSSRSSLQVERAGFKIKSACLLFKISTDQDWMRRKGVNVRGHLGKSSNTESADCEAFGAGPGDLLLHCGDLSYEESRSEDAREFDKKWEELGWESSAAL